MPEIMLALMRSFLNLKESRVWGYLVLPALLSFVLWAALAVWGLDLITTWLLAHPPMRWLLDWDMAWLAYLLAYLGAWTGIFAAAYLTASSLAAVIILPLLLKHLSETEYRDMAPMGRDNFVAAALNSLVAALVFVAAWLLILPLWLIPGMGLLLPLLLMAWFNRRTFAYDALSMHASDEEWRRLRQQNKKPLFMLGLLMALLAHIPFIGFLVPTLAALSFTHFGLEALRRSRNGAIVSMEGKKT